MKSPVHAGSLNTSEVWADDSTSQPAQKLPGFTWFVLVTSVALFLAVGYCFWAYTSGLQSFNQSAAQLKDAPHENTSRLVAQMTDGASGWALRVAIAAGLGGAGLGLIAIIAGFWLRRSWMSRHTKALEALDGNAQRLIAQLADARVTEEEAVIAKSDAEARLTNITQRHKNLELELDQRKQAEKSLAQQAQQLERSKDVLEMHVQARTQELLKLQRRNELILNSAADGICGFDLQGRATFVNPAAAKYTGSKVEELLGKQEDVIFFPPKFKSKEAGFLKDAKGEYLPQQVFVRKDGSTFPAEFVRTPIKENDKTVGSVVVFKDITERRQAEDKLNQKALELTRSNRELEQFAFVASHDLQEPLRKIQAFGDRLKLKCEAVQLDEGRDYLERMQSAAARMQNLINDLLTFSRVISSSQPFVEVDLGQVTKEVLVDLEVRIEKTAAQVTVGKLPLLQADPMQMRQLMQNLIGNALKFQPAGSSPVIKIDAQLVTRSQISDDAALPKSPKATPEDPFCVVTVQDNGIGFDEQYLDKVFAVFQRLHGRSEYEGTGVGLAVCRRITDRHGGLITAQSKPGEGATFIIILPMNHEPAPQTAETK